jgi:lipoprotein-releasing system permease protein
MFHLITLLAHRYLVEATHQRTLNSMVKVCFLSIAVASGALALTWSIMRGFEKATYQKLKNIHADIIVESFEEPIDRDFIAQFAQHHPEITAFSISKTAQALVTSIHNDNQLPQALLIKGIDPIAEARTTALESMLIKTHEERTLQSALDHKQVVIGNRLAQLLNVSVGDKVKLFFAQEFHSTSRRITLDSTVARIGGIFKTGIEEFDASMMLVSLDFFDDLFDQEISSVAIALSATSDQQKFIATSRTQLPYTVNSWKDLYPAICDALRLEKYAMTTILALIALVASMTIISLIFMLISHKQRDIAILLSMGCTIKTMRYLFIAIAACISIPACLVGLLGAYAIGFIINYFSLIELPDVYYISHLPIELEPLTFMLIGCGVIFLTLCATLLPLRTLKDIQLPLILR